MIAILAAAAFASLGIGYFVRTLYRKHVLAERQRKWRIKRLFLDMDTDDSGFLEVEELEQMFVWFKNNLPDDDEHHMPWITKLWNALGSMADRAAPDDDSSSTMSAAKDPAEPAEPSKAIDGSDAPAPTNLSKAETTHAVEGSKMDADAFMAWYLSNTSSFPTAAKHKVLDALEEYVAKEASAVKLFRLWDHDNSGYLDHDEVLTVLRYAPSACGRLNAPARAQASTTTWVFTDALTTTLLLSCPVTFSLPQLVPEAHPC